MVPELSYAQEEGIGNDGGEAGVSVKLRIPVNPTEPVAEKASLPDAAFREAADGLEVLEKLCEEFGLIARVIDGHEGADILIRLLQFAGFDLRHQVLHVEDHTQPFFCPAMLIKKQTISDTNGRIKQKQREFFLM